MIMGVPAEIENNEPGRRDPGGGVKGVPCGLW